MEFNEDIRILCVDDEKSVLKSLQRLFLDEDWEVVIAGSADEGLEILRKDPSFQVIISDYRMPGMTGVDFLREVYKDHPDTVRIVLSGYADTAAIVEAINDGHIYKFIPKPWNDDELKVTIGNAIERFLLHQRNSELSEELRQRNMELERLNEELASLATNRTEELLMQASELMEKEEELMDRNATRAEVLRTFEHLPVGILVISTEGTIRFCNRAIREMNGPGDTPVVGARCSDLLPPDLNALIKQTRDEGQCNTRLSINDRSYRIRGSYSTNNDAPPDVLLALMNEAD